MEQLQKNAKFVILGIGALAFILLAFCPVLDIMGKATVSGFKFIKEGIGSSSSDGTACCYTMLLFTLLPLVSGIYAVAVAELKSTIIGVCFAVAAFMGIITVAMLPEMVSFTFFAWFSLLLCIAGAALAFILGKSSK